MIIDLLFSDCDADALVLPWHINSDGYARMRRARREVTAHAMIAVRMFGKYQHKGLVCDHINHNKLDNRRENLRLVTRAQNAQNLAPTKRGLRGAHWYKPRGKWVAHVKFRQKQYHCGYFDSPEAAAIAAANKRKELGFLDSTPSDFNQLAAASK